MILPLRSVMTRSAGVKGGVIDAAGFDDDQRLGSGAVNATGIAEGVRSQAAAGNLLVGVEDLFAECFEHHGVFLCRRPD